MRSPWRGRLSWKALFRNLYRGYERDDVSGSSAVLSYYFVYSLFPFLFFLATLAAFIPGVHDSIGTLLDDAKHVLPPQALKIIEEQARASDYALVLEPPLAGGRLKTARKGVGRFTLEVTGRPAHAGIEPEKGVSAVGELAHQVLAAGLDRPPPVMPQGEQLLGLVGPCSCPARLNALGSSGCASTSRAIRSFTAAISAIAFLPCARASHREISRKGRAQATPRNAHSRNRAIIQASTYAPSRKAYAGIVPSMTKPNFS